MKRINQLSVCVPIALASWILAGCGQGSVVETPALLQPAATTTAGAGTTEEHGHKPGSHGGLIVSLGRDSYHVEAIVEGKSVLLYTLGSDESRVMEIEAQTLTGYAKQPGATESVALSFEPRPQPGDSDGRTSLFVAALPENLQSVAIDVTVPNIVIEGERFRLGFTTGQAADHGGTDSMPAKVADDKERELYLTPGGAYTEEDIAANGNITVSQKFKGVMAAHDLNPKAGDMLCPITFTKANSKFTWIVGGKSYQFCCPPCVDEFVATAKREPAAIKDPSDYIKR